MASCPVWARESRPAIRSLLVAAALLGLGAAQEDPAKGLLEELRGYRYRLLREAHRDGHFGLILCDADGANEVKLTRTPDVDELYPQASPDGKQVAFVCDEGGGDAKARNVYVMNLDGTGRRKIADHGRDPCWSPDGKKIAYLGNEFERRDLEAWATKGIFIHDLETGKTREHPNRRIEHLYTMAWSPCGRWFVATVHGGMGFDHSIVAIEADGPAVHDLKLPGCRPDLSADGKRVAWGYGDYQIGVADLDLAASPPKATNLRSIVTSPEPLMTYHADWSPDGKYLAFSLGPQRPGKSLKGLYAQCPGIEAPGWDTCVADPSRENRWVRITHDGRSNKEPDWVPAR
jgi:Tol biopolymer transport system component